MKVNSSCSLILYDNVQVSYIDIDHFKSKYTVLCRQLEKDVPIRRVFNMSSF